MKYFSYFLLHFALPGYLFELNFRNIRVFSIIFLFIFDTLKYWVYF